MDKLYLISLLEEALDHIKGADEPSQEDTTEYNAFDSQGFNAFNQTPEFNPFTQAN